MIKLCKVLYFNKTTHVVVALFDTIQIQFTTDEDFVGSTAYIKMVDSSYKIVDKQEYEKYTKASKKKIETEDAFVGE